MKSLRLNIISEPLIKPVGRGRVILQDKSIPIRGNNPTIEFLCGSCGSPVIIGLDLIIFRFMFGNAEILVRCNSCNSYNDATPAPPGPYQLDSDLLDHVKSLMSNALKFRNKLFLQFQNMGLEDPRISIAGHLLDIASAAFLNLIHEKENLRFAAWWENHGFGTAVTAGIVPGLLESYDTINTVSLMFFSFSLFESGIRRIVRAIDPMACSAGAAQFRNIYEWLFAKLRKDGWSYFPGDPSNFLDLYRVFRNTLHNNGAFYPPSGSDQEIEWLGQKYMFQYAIVPVFYGWEFNIMLLRGLVDLNYSIMTSKMVSNLPRIP